MKAITGLGVTVCWDEYFMNEGRPGEQHPPRCDPARNATPKILICLFRLKIKPEVLEIHKLNYSVIDSSMRMQVPRRA